MWSYFSSLGVAYNPKLLSDAADEIKRLRARVAELEASAKLAPTANGGAGSNQADASRLAYAITETSTDKYAEVRDAVGTLAASAQQQGDAEPMAWGVVARQTNEIPPGCAQSQAKNFALKTGGTVVPLYRSLPQPRGWLTAEESVLIARIAHDTREDDPVSQGRPYFITVREAAVARALLARDAPPKVVKPLEPPPHRYGDDAIANRDAQWIAALAAAGVEVEE